MTTDEKPARPSSWDDWYRFAQEELGLLHEESVEYANHRYVEERNRASGPVSLNRPPLERRYARDRRRRLEPSDRPTVRR
jgi:hypothetical protein